MPSHPPYALISLTIRKSFDLLLVHFIYWLSLKWIELLRIRDYFQVVLLRKTRALPCPTVLSGTDLLIEVSLFIFSSFASQNRSFAPPDFFSSFASRNRAQVPARLSCRVPLVGYSERPLLVFYILGFDFTHFCVSSFSSLYHRCIVQFSRYNRICFAILLACTFKNEQCVPFGSFLSTF